MGGKKELTLGIFVMSVGLFLFGCGSPQLDTGDVAPDFNLPDGNGNTVNLADELQKNEHVVLVFYYSWLCPACMAQLRDIENDRAKYEAAGAQVIAIAVQAKPEAEISATASKAQFPILADGDHAVTEAYGIVDDNFSTPSSTHRRQWHGHRRPACGLFRPRRRPA